MGSHKTHEQFLKDLSLVNPDIEPIESYVSSSAPISCRCKKCGHIWNVRPGNLLHGYGCPKCGLKKRALSQTKKTSDFLLEMKTINPKIEIQEEYQGARQPINCKCKTCGHIWKAAPTNLLKGKGCPKCARAIAAEKTRRTQEDFVARIRQFGHNIEPTEQFKGNSSSIQMKCNECGYIWTTTASSIVYGSGCPRCSKNGIYSQEEFVEKLREINPFVTALSSYQRSAKPITCKCEICGHIWESTPNRLLHGNGCPACYHSTTSFIEQVLLESLELVFGIGNVLSRDRAAIGKELDILIPSINVAIEPGSWRWHKDKLQNDKQKRLLCHKKGIRLITIYSDYNETSIPFDRDCICVKETLGFEKDRIVLKTLVSDLFNLIGIKKDFSEQQWNEIIRKAYSQSRRLTTEEFRKRVNEVNPSIIVTGEYTGSWNKIECECLRCKFQWKTIANNLLRGHGCPKCAKQKNGLKNRKSATQFENDLNRINDSIQLISPYTLSSEKVKCHCLKCGNEWESLPGNLLRGKGCPACALLNGKSKKQKRHEQFVEELRALNNQVIVIDYYINASQKLKCKCSICGHTWEASPANLLRGTGCPQCAKEKKRNKQKETVLKKSGSLKDKNPALAEQWHPTLNGSLSPDQITPGSDFKAWWICPSCGNEWSAAVGSRNRGHGCPKCSRKAK